MYKSHFACYERTVLYRVLVTVTAGKKKSPMSSFYMVMDLGLTENFTILNIFDSLECL